MGRCFVDLCTAGSGRLEAGLAPTSFYWLADWLYTLVYKNVARSHEKLYVKPISSEAPDEPIFPKFNTEA